MRCTHASTHQQIGIWCFALQQSLFSIHSSSSGGSCGTTAWHVCHVLSRSQHVDRCATFDTLPYPVMQSLQQCWCSSPSNMTMQECHTSDAPAILTALTLPVAGPMPTWRSRWRRQLPKPQQQQQPQPPQPHQQPPQQLQRLQLQRLYLRKTATAGHDMTEALQEQRVPMMSWFSWLPPVATVSALGFWCWMGECTTAATAQGATCG